VLESASTVFEGQWMGYVVEYSTGRYGIRTVGT